MALNLKFPFFAKANKNAPVTDFQSLDVLVSDLENISGAITGTFDNIHVLYDAEIDGNLNVHTDATVDGDLTVHTDTLIDGNLEVNNNATIRNQLTVENIAGGRSVIINQDGSLEILRPAVSGGNPYIDFKKASATDYNVRIGQDGTNDAFGIAAGYPNPYTFYVFPTYTKVSNSLKVKDDIYYNKKASATIVGSNISAANIKSGIVKIPVSGTTIINLPTGASLDAQFPDMENQECYQFMIYPTGGTTALDFVQLQNGVGCTCDDSLNRNSTNIIYPRIVILQKFAASSYAIY